jgi:hypothetical protein
VDEPFIRGLTSSATWVAPKVYCEVHQDGFDEMKHLKAPSFANILSQ